MAKKNFPWHKYPAVPVVIENTDFKTYEKAVAAIQTLAWLEDGAPHTFDGLPGVFRFDMTLYVQKSDCGTNCCIAGAMASYMDHKGTLKDEYGDMIYDAENSNLDSVFDINFNDGSDLDKLFYPKNKQGDIRKTSAAVAARTLRRYMETGRVSYRA